MKKETEAMIEIEFDEYKKLLEYKGKYELLKDLYDTLLNRTINKHSSSCGGCSSTGTVSSYYSSHPYNTYTVTKPQ